MSQSNSDQRRPFLSAPNPQRYFAAGAIDDAQMLTWIGYKVAQEPKIPEWKPGTEFKGKRDESMRGMQ